MKVDDKRGISTSTISISLSLVYVGSVLATDSEKQYDSVHVTLFKGVVTKVKFAYICIHVCLKVKQCKISH